MKLVIHEDAPEADVFVDDEAELRDEADDFEDALAAEMIRTGRIELWWQADHDR